MYKRLAAVICPSAPFLIPKRAIQSPHAPSYIAAVTQLHPTHYGYSTRTREIKKKRRKEAGVAKAQAVEAELQALKQQGPSAEDVAAHAQQLQQALRTRNKPPGATYELYAQALSLANDIRKGKLPGSAESSVHLLGIFRDTKHYDEGVKFWNWVKDREDGSVGPGVYGVALELLAYRGTTLDIVEQLYREALERYSGTFAEYHFLPTGIVPDRRIRLPAVHGLHMSLLQGILTARSLLGAWRSAYMSFDTSLRLMPDRTLSGMYSRLITERSITEALIVYAMACRSLSAVSPGSITTLLQRLAEHQKYSRHPEQIEFNIELAVMMLEVLRLRIMAGYQLQPEHLSIVIKGMRNTTIPQTINVTEKDHSKMYNDDIVNLSRQLVETLVQSDKVASPQKHNSVYNALLALAVTRNHDETVQWAQHQLLQCNYHNDRFAHNSLLLAAGHSGDLDGIIKHWNEIVRISEQHPYWKEWTALADRCRTFAQDSEKFEELKTFLNSQWDEYGLHRSNAETHRTSLQDLLSRTGPRQRDGEYGGDLPSPGQTQAFANRMRSSVHEVLGANTSIDSFFTTTLFKTAKRSNWISPSEQTRGPINDENINDGTFSDISMPSPHSESPPPPPDYEAQLTEIYDSLTTDPSTPQQPLPPKTQLVDSAGIRYDVHRFENWKNVNKLLAIAEAVESKKQIEVEKAMASETTATLDMQNIEKWALETMRGWDGRVWSVHGEELRERILKLRGMM